MSDLPQHAAQVATWIALGRPHYAYAPLFTLNWLTPYLLGYVLTRLFALFFSVPVAIKIVVSLSMAALPLSTARLLRSAGGDPRWAMIMAPLGFTMSFYWGFLNFLVATPAAILFLAHAFEYAQAPSRRKGAWLGFFAFFLLLCHALILAFSCAIAAIMILGATKSWKRLWPLAMPWPAAVIWIIVTLNRDSTLHQAVAYQWNWARFSQFSSEIFGLSVGFDRVQFACALGLCVLPFLMGARVRRSRLLPSAAATLLFFTLPFCVFGTSYIYPRFAVFVIPLALFGLEASSLPRLPRLGPALGLALVLVSMLALTRRFRAYEDEARDFDAVLNAMEPGRTALSLVYLPGSAAIAAPVFLHFPMWYEATRGGVVEPSFADGFPQLVRHRPTVGAMPSAWSPRDFRWETNGGHDYFVVRARADVAPHLFAGKPVSLTVNRGLWWLYRRRPESVRITSRR